MQDYCKNNVISVTIDLFCKKVRNLRHKIDVIQLFFCRHNCTDVQKIILRKRLRKIALPVVTSLPTYLELPSAEDGCPEREKLPPPVHSISTETSYVKLDRVNLPRRKLVHFSRFFNLLIEAICLR